MFVLPFGAAIFVPASFLRGDFALPAAIAAPVLAAAASLGLAVFVWQAAVRRYESTGS